MKKNLFLGVLFCALQMQVHAELLPYPTDTINGQIVYKYQVPRSIGLYRVSVNFGVTQEEIITWNPQLKERGLHYAETILIPAKGVELQTASVAQAPIEQPAETPVQTPADSIAIVADTVVNTAIDSIASTAADSLLAADSIQPVKIAVLLPLQAEVKQRDPGLDRFVDFYEGLLLAIADESKQTNYELFVYDIGKTETVVNQLVSDSILHRMNAIVGPAYPAQVEQVAKVALSDSIPTFIPFTNKVKGIESNPYLFQFNPDVKSEARALASYLEARKDSVNCVLVDAKEADIPYSIREFRQEVRNRGLSNTRISVHDILIDSIGKALKDSVENIIVFNSEKFSNLQLLLPHVMNGKAGKAVTLYSQYSWQKEKILLPQIFTSVFATDLPADLTHYNTEYDLYFKNQPVSDMPRFDLLGYDITRQLIAWMNGKEYFGLQSDMLFEPVGTNGGYINTKVAVIRK